MRKKGIWAWVAMLLLLNAEAKIELIEGSFAEFYPDRPWDSPLGRAYILEQSNLPYLTLSDASALGFAFFGLPSGPRPGTLSGVIFMGNKNLLRLIPPQQTGEEVSAILEELGKEQQKKMVELRQCIEQSCKSHQMKTASCFSVYARFIQGIHQESEASLRKILDRNYLSLETVYDLFLRGVLRFNQGDYQGAKEDFEHARQFLKNQAIALYALAAVDLASGKEAWKNLNLALASDPNGWVYSELKARLLLEDKKDIEAFATLRAFHDNVDSGIVSIDWLAGDIAYNLLHNYKEARQFYQDALDALKGMGSYLGSWISWGRTGVTINDSVVRGYLAFTIAMAEQKLDHPRNSVKWLSDALAEIEGHSKLQAMFVEAWKKDEKLSLYEAIKGFMKSVDFCKS